MQENINLLIDSIKNKKRCDSLFLCEKLEDLEFYKKQVRLALDNCGVIEPLKLNHYVSRSGYEGLKKALAMTRQEVIELAKQAGLAHFYDSEGHCTGVTNAVLIDADKERNDDRLVEMLMPFAKLVEERTLTLATI